MTTINKICVTAKILDLVEVGRLNAIMLKTQIAANAADKPPPRWLNFVKITVKIKTAIPFIAARSIDVVPEFRRLIKDDHTLRHQLPLALPNYTSPH